MTGWKHDLSRLKLAVAALLCSKAIVFVALIPPWQVPDEPSHFEYAVHMQQPTVDLHAQIVSSMEDFESWKYAESALPAGDFLSIVGQYPPLYYRLASYWLPSSSLLAKLYALRLRSLLFQLLFFIGCAWLAWSLQRPTDSVEHAVSGAQSEGAALLDVTQERQQGSKTGALVSTMVAAAALLVPQNCLFFSGVLPDLLAIVIVTFVLAILISFSRVRSSGSPRGTTTLLKLAALVILLAAAFLTKANTLIVFPLTMAAAALLLFRLRTWQEWRAWLMAMLGVIALLFFLVPLVGFYYDLFALAERAAPIVARSLHPVASLSTISPGLLGRFVAILFVSFWYSFGWMVFKMAVPWYGIFGLIAVLSLIGWLVARRRLANPTNVAVCAIALILSIWVVFLDRGPGRLEMITQARFIFPVTAAAMALVVMGWGGLFLAGGISRRPGRSGIGAQRGRDCATAVLIIFLLFTNLVVVFKYVIPVFYLK